MELPNNIAVKSSNMSVGTEVRVGIDEKSLAHILRSLTIMYANPHYAVLREYVANSFDSHVRAGQIRPIELTLPTMLNLELVIRDFGLGMSREEIMKVYSQVGASTKRDSNDQIGAFGLGSKSALAVAGGYSFIAIQDGKKNSVLVAPDFDGVPVFRVLDEVDTDESNGVEVRIPASSADIYAYQNALYHEKNLFFAYPKGTLLVDGEELKSGNLFDERSFTAVTPNAFVSKVDTSYARSWRRTTSLAYSTLVVVGPNTYSISSKQVEAIDAMVQEKLGTKVSSYGKLIVRIPNGAATLVPNRDDFVYDSKTKTIIADAIVEAVKAHAQKAQAEIDKAKDYIDAVIIAQNVDNFDGFPFSYKGEPFGKLATTNRYTVNGTQEMDAVAIDEKTGKASRQHGAHSFIEELQSVDYFVHSVPKTSIGPSTAGFSALLDGKALRVIALTSTIEKFDSNLEGHSKVISFDEVQEKAKTARRLNAAPRAKTSSVPKLSILGRGGFALTEITPEFKEAHTFVAIDASNDLHARTIRAIAGKSGNSFPLSAIVRRMMDNGYAFVSINKTHTIEKVTTVASYPISFENALVKQIGEIATEFSSNNPEVMAHIDRSNIYAASVDYSLIQNEESAEWMKAYVKASNTMNRSSTVASVFASKSHELTNLKSASPAIVKAYTDAVDMIQASTVARKYPMLKLMSYVSEKREWKVVADYINLCDSQEEIVEKSDELLIAA